MGRDTLGVWDKHHIHTAVYKTANKDLLYSIGNYIHHLIITYNGKGFFLMYFICMYIYFKKLNQFVVFLK